MISLCVSLFLKFILLGTDRLFQSESSSLSLVLGCGAVRKKPEKLHGSIYQSAKEGRKWTGWPEYWRGNFKGL